MDKNEFKSFLREVILEVKKENKDYEDSSYFKKKDKQNDYLNGEQDKYRKDVDNDPSKTVESLVKKIEYAVKRIDKKITVELDDHNDITIILAGVFRVRVIPKWSGIFDVEAFRNMSDRIYAVGLDNEQVLNFIKVNFAVTKKSYVQTAYDKSMSNLEDKSKKKAKELPKGESVKEKDIPEKDKEDEVSEKTDQPDSPMSVVKETDIQKQSDHGVEKNKEMSKIQKMIKTEVDDDLTKSWKK
jgi:hypothetical protein